MRRQPGQQIEQRRCAVAPDYLEHPVDRVVEDHRRKVLVVAERLTGQEGKANEGARGGDQGQRSAVARAVPQDGQPVVHGDKVTEDKVIIGDPIGGKKEWSHENFKKKCWSTAIVLKRIPIQ